MDNDKEFDIRKTKLLNHVTSAKEIVESIKELDEIRTNLKNKAKELKKIADDLDQYAKDLEAKSIATKVKTLEVAVNKLSEEDLITCRDVLMQLITVNLPEQLDPKMTDDTIVISQYIKGDKTQPVLTKVCTILFASFDKGAIKIEVKFDNYKNGDKDFNLKDFKKIYSVVDYIILVLGFGKTLS